MIEVRAPHHNLQDPPGDGLWQNHLGVIGNRFQNFDEAEPTKHEPLQCLHHQPGWPDLYPNNLTILSAFHHFIAIDSMAFGRYENNVNRRDLIINFDQATVADNNVASSFFEINQVG